MGNVGYGIVAGLVATIVLSVLMVLKSAAGMMPEMNAIRMLSQMANGYLGLPATPIIGWIAHFAIGTILWGILFALLIDPLPGGNRIGKGVVFSIGAWLLMMIIVMPMAGAGLFAMSIGVGAAIATLVLHVIFGVVLGAVYGWMEGRSAKPAAQHR